MWAIRILSGPQAGQIYNLKNGKNRLGRNPQSDISINSQGVSKDHLEIQVFSNKILVSDLKSSNGSYVNGVRIQNALIRMGDRISAHNILFEVVAAPMQAPVPARPRSDFQMPISRPTDALPDSEVAAPVSKKFDLLAKAKEYNDRVVLPGFYRLLELFEFKTVVFGFGAVFILLVTLLSVIPMKQITSESIQMESRRRAQTVARALAQANERVIRSGDLSNFSVDFVLREDGIDDVYIVSKEGTIIAPPERAGSRPKQTAFIEKVRGQIREIAGEVGIDRVAAAYPIVSFDAEMQVNVPRAYAVVVFNTGSLQFDDGRALSLFVQMIVIAGLLGSALFFLLYKLIEYPWASLKEDMDAALRDGRDQIQLKIKFPAALGLLTNLNSLLVRALNPQSVAGEEVSVNRDQEMKNLCNMVGYPAFIFNRAGAVVAMNSSFESLTGISPLNLMGQNIQQIPDQAMQKNIEYLSQQVRTNPNQVFSDSFEVGGHPLKIHCQSFISPRGEVDYFMVTMTPIVQAEGGAA
jgi:hypothetical protein